MEHEDNAHFDFLQNRLTESLQNAGSAGNAADVAAELVANIGPKTGEHDGEHDDDEEWKYIKEVQQSEKQQQQQFYGENFNDADADADVDVAFGVGNGIGTAAVGNGNGVGGSSSDAYMSLGMDLSLGNGVGVAIGSGSAAGFRAYEGEVAAEEEDVDVEVIKNDGDFSTNSNTTTTSTTGEVEQHQQQQQVEQSTLPQLVKEEQLQHQDDDEEEPSSVATTYGTSSLSEQQQEPENIEVAEPQPVFFDNKENADPIGHQVDRPVIDVELELESDAHSQLNPNAVEFVPHFGSQPASPVPSSLLDPLQTLSRQLMADDLVAESPRKGTRDCNMDAIAVPDESEFDNEAAKRPHELEHEDDTFPDAVEQLQLQNGSGLYQQNQQLEQEQQQQEQHLDHGPETSVDLDEDLEPEPQREPELDRISVQDDIMKRSIYGGSNASIEDILNSVQPLPQQTSGEEPLKEKELLNVEEKELVSQSPSIEELHQHQLQQLVDPMQASFYLEHTSSDAFGEQADEQLNDQSLLLNTSAPMFSPLEDSPHLDTQPTAKTLDLHPEQADIVDITPSPLSSSTEEKHLVEETKEQLHEPQLFSENVENFGSDAGVSPQVSVYLETKEDFSYYLEI